MQNRDSVPQDLARHCTFPYALYDSNGLLFELYEGGEPNYRHRRCERQSPVSLQLHQGAQPQKTYRVVWERLRPIRVLNSEELRPATIENHQLAATVE